MVRVFSQDGQEWQDFDFSALVMAPSLRDVLVDAFVRRTAPGAGLASLRSVQQVHSTVVWLDRYLATLAWPPTALSQLTPEHIDGFRDSFTHRRSTAAAVGGLKLLLAKAEGISAATAGRLARPLPKVVRGEPKESYSRAEFQRIADAARSDLRSAAARIRGNRELLEHFRVGAVDPAGDRRLARRLEVLDCVDRFGDVPRATAPAAWPPGKPPKPR